MNKILSIIAVVVGLALVFIAGMYFVLPARNLPVFFPGYSMSLVRHHYTHGGAVLILGLLAFIIAWMLSGKKSSK